MLKRSQNTKGFLIIRANAILFGRMKFLYEFVYNGGAVINESEEASLETEKGQGVELEARKVWRPNSSAKISSSQPCSNLKTSAALATFLILFPAGQARYLGSLQLYVFVGARASSPKQSRHRADLEILYSAPIIAEFD